MNQEVRTCQNCKTEFTIEPEDFAFYEKIKVSPPTFCPGCRRQRRLATFNLFYLYKRSCDLCKKEVVSMYAPDAPYRVYCPQCWWSDNWDPFKYGRDYDFSRPFFQQWAQLLHEVPLLGLSLDLQTTKYSPHNNHAGWLKNCYLLFHADNNEDCAYGFFLLHSKSMLDCSLVHTCELCYDALNTHKSNRCIGSRKQVTESIDCVFVRDCRGCQNCFASANLRNKKYYIFNKPHSKEDYFREIKKWDLGSFKTYQEVKKLAEEHWKKFPPKPQYDEMSINSTGNYVFQSKNCKECFEVGSAEDCKWMFMTYGPPIKDCYDISTFGDNLTLSYDSCVVGGDASNIKFCQESGLGLYDAQYCKTSLGGSHHFGCVSAKKGNHIILNKPHSEEDFNRLREKIVEHMNTMPYTDKKGRVYTYGEFFPTELSPFAYNETIAQNFFPFSQKEIQDQGYTWREAQKREYKVSKQADELPDHIKDITDEVLQEVIGCKKCGRGFKIIPQELTFLRQMNLPLPRECPFCRIDEKFQLWVKNLRILKRTCSKCGSEFETSYPEDEVAYILCKPCYQEELV